MVSAKNAKNKRVICHDCEREIEVKGNEIKNGVMLVYENGGEKITIFKCKDCFEKISGIEKLSTLRSLFKSCWVFETSSTMEFGKATRVQRKERIQNKNLKRSISNKIKNYGNKKS